MVSSVSSSNLSYYQGQAALSLLTPTTTTTTDPLTGLTTTSSSSTTDITGSLLGYLTAKEGIGTAATTTSAVTAPTAPWQSSTGSPSVSAAVQSAISGAAFVNPSNAKLNAPGGVSTTDYKNLFALYQGLNTLNDIAQTAVNAGTSSADPTLSSVSTAQLQAAFSTGISQIQSFLSNDPFQEFNLVAGKVSTTEQSTVGIPNGTYQTYTTGVIGTGDASQPLAALQGNVQFTLSVSNPYLATVKNQALNTPTTVNIDLTGMGDKPRTINNVVNYINAQLKAAGVSTTFSAANLGNSNVTTTVAGKTTTSATGPPNWGLTINGNASETISLSAPSTAAAVYVAAATGGATTYTTTSSTGTTTTSGTQTTTPTGESLIKLQTPDDQTGTAVTAANSTAANPGLPTGGVFAKTLPDGVTSVQASATGSDGSVYMLADVTGSLNGATVSGGQGVALLKYDSSGKLLYSKIVPGQTDATGYSLAVSADGSVAVAGSNTTPASISSSGLTKAASTSAFVQVYSSTGAASWSQTIPAAAGGATATGVTFDANDNVYVSGITTGSVGGQTQHGSADEFIQGFTSAGKATFTTQYGTTGTNVSSGIAYDSATNTLYTAALENSQAVVRSFALNGTKAPTPVATRNLGNADSIVGIGITNGQVVVAGNAIAGTIKSGTATNSYAGVEDGFVASISTGLAASASDTVTYLGQSGATQVATGLSVAGGHAYVTGTIANDPNSVAAADATEGFVSSVDTSTGAVSYSSKFSIANGQAAPSTIAVSTTGTSVLDQLGLPTGTINAANSSLITANTAIKAGDSFYVRTSPGGAQTKITIAANDTLTTLANKINTALGAAGKAAVVVIGANSQLSITPTSSSSFIELDSQQAASTVGYTGSTSSAPNTNVLSALGLSAGVIRTVATINKLVDVKQLREYGLNLPSNLDLSTATSAQHAVNAIQAAISAVQKAYTDLANPPTMASEQAAAASSSGGAVPAYLTAEIANYQAGLSRLLGSSSSSTSSSSSSSLSSAAVASALLSS
jgi:hypothetical protein